MKAIDKKREGKESFGRDVLEVTMPIIFVAKESASHGLVRKP
jgi:hypothetical protein